jgi:hypothetical protein
MRHPFDGQTEKAAIRRARKGRRACRASACHRTVAGAARWHIRRRSGPHDGAIERPARGARLGTNRTPARPPQAGEFTVARTCVLIKTASHPGRTCVLITCMSQATHGPWPRSDVIPWCRQNGRGALPGTAGPSMTCHDRPSAAAASRPGRGAARHAVPAERGAAAAAGLGRSRKSARPLPTNARARPAEPK